MFRYEHKQQKLASRQVFLGRVARSALVGLIAISVSLVIGMAGYMTLADQKPVDAFLEASMILGGMGPVGHLESDGAKIFAGVYALYSGLLLIAVTGIVLAPVLHRVLHAIHADDEQS
jgi:hypothetical protein